MNLLLNVPDVQIQEPKKKSEALDTNKTNFYYLIIILIQYYKLIKHLVFIFGSE